LHLLALWFTVLLFLTFLLFYTIVFDMIKAYTDLLRRRMMNGKQHDRGLADVLP
jgi:hypothetical protein